MQLMKLIHNKYKIVSVVGMAKNAGKTVTLNRLIEEAAEGNILLGLTSTGRDGEKKDIVTMTEKPRIYVKEKTLIATAQNTLSHSDVRLEILEVTDFQTPMGPVVIGRVKSSGFIEIAGPETNSQIRQVAVKMLNYGAELVVVDGAINRKTAASPAVTEATILATGAVLSRDINKVVEETIHQVNLFNLEAVEDIHLRQLASKLIEEKTYAIIDDEGKIKMLNIPTALNCGRIIGGALKENSAYVIICGSLVRKTLEDIMAVTKHYQKVTFIVKDATRIFIDPKEWLFLKRRGIQCKVIEKINTLAVTLNPYSPKGYGFGPREFQQKMKTNIRSLPVVDVMLEDEEYDE